MKSLFIEKKQAYDGTQLRSLYAYLDHKVLGPSVVSWVGPCSISFDHMVDGEDLLEGAEIRGDEMLHFIIEIFDRDLFSGVALQRLFAAIARDYLAEQSGQMLFREGDDLFFNEGKLSISIATKSPVSVMVHFAMNVVNEGTPVKTSCLNDLRLNPRQVATDLMTLLMEEYNDILMATQKVRPIG